ncbi:hypothetical protein QBC32DRAFT_343131 [Pseudoneurospora amorphoporcata]|uniref:Secreted protein n=1 Tax=Pseudoneurospora amorphoporcata TaxID=241081 RepID=A0AAN6NVC6_9PEZI|nr:hypothetical protein QBC32DRAFT_343131 [Pseudoneurospora amorphoporcata]
MSIWGISGIELLLTVPLAMCLHPCLAPNMAFFQSCGCTSKAGWDGSAVADYKTGALIFPAPNNESRSSPHSPRTDDRVWARLDRLNSSWTLRSRPGHLLPILTPTGSSPGMSDDDKARPKLTAHPIYSSCSAAVFTQPPVVSSLP